MTLEYLRSILDYDPLTGLFRWRVRRSGHNGGVRPGDVAGSIQGGYVQIRIDGRPYRGHRLAWFYAHGAWPHQLDHANHDPADNRLANLRETTHAQNQANRPAPRHNTSGHKGVSLHRATGKFRARITVNGEERHLGLFRTAEQAADAYRQAATKAQGEFAHHRKPSVSPSSRISP